jgi:RNA polymerase sigma-70 factor (ECF subfamily)
VTARPLDRCSSRRVGGFQGRAISTADTATALGIGEEAAKVRLHRARTMLRRALAELTDHAVSEAFPFQAPRCNRIVESVTAAIARLGKPGAA